MNEEENAENLRGGINLLQRLLPPIMESPLHIYNDFLLKSSNGKTNAEILLWTFMRLFFKPGFCIGNSKDGKLYDILEFIIWHSGVKYNNTVHDNETQYNHNRLCLMQLMLITFSSALYLTTKESSQYTDFMLMLFCSKYSEEADKMLCSLLNFAFNYQEKSFVISFIYRLIHS